MQIDSSRSSKTREKTIAALSPSQTGQESEPPSVVGADIYQPCLGSAVPLPVAAAHERTGIFLACASTKGHFLTRGIAARLVRDLSEAPSRLSGSLWSSERCDHFLTLDDETFPITTANAPRHSILQEQPRDQPSSGCQDKRLSRLKRQSPLFRFGESRVQSDLKSDT